MQFASNSNSNLSDECKKQLKQSSTPLQEKLTLLLDEIQKMQLSAGSKSQATFLIYPRIMVVLLPSILLSLTCSLLFSWLFSSECFSACFCYFTTVFYLLVPSSLQVSRLKPTVVTNKTKSVQLESRSQQTVKIQVEVSVY